MLWPAGCGGVCNVMSRIVASLVCNLTMRRILRHIESNIPSIITFHSTHSLLAESTTAAQSSAPARNYLIWWVASPFENRNFTKIKQWTFLRGEALRILFTDSHGSDKIQTTGLKLCNQNSILVTSYFQHILIITEPLPTAEYLSF